LGAKYEKIKNNMTPEQFTSYLQDEAYLHQLSYQELKSLVIQYPFCQNFRMLLLKKSQLENHKNLEDDLQKAAVYASDRRFLYRTVKRLRNQGIILEKETETILELTDFSSIDNLLIDKQLEEIFIEIQPSPIEKEKSIGVPIQSLELENWMQHSNKNNESKEFLFEISSLLEAADADKTTKNVRKEVPELVFEEPLDYTSHLKSLFEVPANDDNLFENLTAFEQGIPFGEAADVIESLWMPIEDELTAIMPFKPQIVFNENQNELPLNIATQPIITQEMLPIVENKTIEIQSNDSELIDNQLIDEDDMLYDKDENLEKNFVHISEDEAIEDLIAEFKTIGLNKNLSTTHFITNHRSEETEMKAKQAKLIARDPVDFNEWLQQYQQNVYENGSKPIPTSNNLDKLSEKRTVVEWSEWVGAPTTKSKNGGDNEKKRKDEMPLFLTKSLKQREDIASETLADLLANQGNIEQAIKMYEVLCLENPDKNRFFAQKIQLLKESLKK
jgi:hypothetical protein